MKASEYRLAAYQSLSGRWQPAIYATLLYVLFTITYVLLNLSMTNLSTGMAIIWGLLYPLIAILIITPLGYGFNNALLWYSRRDEEASPAVNMIRIPFQSGMYSSLLGVGVLQMLISLITIFILVPFLVAGILTSIDKIDPASLQADPNLLFDQLSAKGIALVATGYFLMIIAALYIQYTYYMAKYIVIDQPQLSAYDSLTASRKLMNGYKWQLFLLHLSFIGWALLAICSCGIGFIWLIPYMQTADALFYEHILQQKQNIINTEE